MLVLYCSTCKYCGKVKMCLQSMYFKTSMIFWIVSEWKLYLTVLCFINKVTGTTGLEEISIVPGIFFLN